MNIINFPLCITSSRTYSLNPRLYPATPGLSKWSPKPDYPTTIRCRASPGLFGHYPKPGLLPECLATIRSRACPGLSEWSPKPGCSPTIRLLSEVGLSLTPETAQGLSTKARTYLCNNYNTNVRKDKLSPHTHTPNTNTYDTQWTRFMDISPLTNVCLSPIKSEHKLTLPAPTRDLSRAAFGMEIMCPSCDTSRAIAHALWRLLSNDLNDTPLTGMLNAARLSCFAHCNI